MKSEALPRTAPYSLNSVRIHARVGRDIVICTRRNLKFIHFNSHARVGRDFFISLRLFWNKISTHTPAWGVTPVRKHECMLYCYFNSHARVGRDLRISSSDKYSLEFQLTRPRGA